MAITSYSELQTAIANYAHRSGDTTFTDRVTELIAMAEARMNDLLILRSYESEESITLTTGQNYVALPTGYLAPIALWLIISGERTAPLQWVLPQELPYSTANSIPKQCAIDAANIRFDCPAASGYSGKFRMLKSSNLSGSNTTNALLTKRPDVYMAACMVEAGRFTGNDKLFAMYEPKFLQGVKELKAAENRGRSIAPLRSDFPCGGRSSSIEAGG